MLNTRAHNKLSGVIEGRKLRKVLCSGITPPTMQCAQWAARSVCAMSSTRQERLDFKTVHLRLLQYVPCDWLCEAGALA